MKFSHDQRGLSGFSFIVVMMVLGFFIMALIKLVPIYMESWTVKAAVTAAIDGGGYDTSPLEIRKRINRQFTVNQVTVIAVKDIKIKYQDNGKISVDASYQKRIPFIQNIDVVVKFDEFKFEAQGKYN
jgi:hypothetical protein